MARVACEVRRATKIPLGINVLRNDAESALAIALEVLLRLQQRFEVAPPSAEAALCGLLITHAGFQVLAQQLEAFGGLGRQAEGDMAIGTGF